MGRALRYCLYVSCFLIPLGKSQYYFGLVKFVAANGVTFRPDALLL